MKKNIIFLFTFFSTILFAQGIKFEQNTFSSILEKAKKENRSFNNFIETHLTKLKEEEERKYEHRAA